MRHAPKPYARSERIARQLQRDLVELIRDELKDPRIGLFTLTEVRVSPDLGHARVFYTQPYGENADTQKALSESAGYLRNLLGKRIKLFRIPLLAFHYDHIIEQGEALDALIDAANARREESK